MGRSAQSFNRREPKFLPQPIVLVICEDEKSGRVYLQDAAANLHLEVKVDVTHCGKTDPKNIVLEAIGRAKKFDRVFCVIDRDSHPNFDEALALAKNHNNVDVVVTYPCFEYWLLLHFGYTRKPYTAVGKRSAGDSCIKDLRDQKGFEKYAKGAVDGLFKQLLDRLPNARLNGAKSLEDAHAEDEMNPSTRLHELLDYFDELAKPQLA